RTGDSEWTITGASGPRLHNTANQPAFTALDGPGDRALKLFGDGAAATQWFYAPPPGEALDLLVHARVNPDDPLPLGARANAILRFYDIADALLGSASLALADDITPHGTWLTRTLTAFVPESAAYGT